MIGLLLIPAAVPRPGWEYKEICFLIVVDDKGNFIDVEDTRELVEGRLVPKAFLVPQSAPRSGTKRKLSNDVLVMGSRGICVGYNE